MSDLSNDIETLRLWRENNDRKSRETINMWNETLGKNIDKLGKETHVILEQVCLAALDFYNVDIAQKCIWRLYKEFPDSLRVKKLEAMYHEASENYEKALSIINEIIKADPTNSAARKRKVAVLKAQNKIPEAIKELVDYLKIFMVDAEAWQELSELYLTENDYNKAAFCIEELLLHNPHNHLLHQRLADIRYTQGGFENLELARAYYCQAVKLNPKNLRALLGLHMTVSNLQYAPRSTPQKKKENQQLSQWALEEIRKMYSKETAVESLEDRLSALQL
ncbi:ER membrane protein complex subunit 2-like [Coccinella septempunctata]|uniref:ER membrane protein complex subunit 2-like n=1 Tax=Coccinella septempunctata TaxID=41139 RepID=UPI001D06482B|nr:ER membrane protein complex subunit 2-like [Coccinella septempunctata]